LKSAATAAVAIEIFDAAKKLVRRYASDDKPEPIDPELNLPAYWIRPPQILQASAGMHRFAWDLHYPPPDSLRHQYPISAIYRDTPRYPLGAAVLPGQYTVKLTVDGRSYTQPLTVKMDPRVKTPPAGLVQQFTLARKVTDMMHQGYGAFNKVRELRAKLKQDPALDKEAAALEGSAGRRPVEEDEEENSGGLTRLNADLASTLGVIEGADATPTTQAVSTVAQLERRLRQLLTRVSELEKKAQ
jgi:hypothetical protein